MEKTDVFFVAQVSDKTQSLQRHRSGDILFHTTSTELTCFVNLDFDQWQQILKY
ncbi:hypothetical protein QG37_07931 [Candidozyma auris]|uniref:Uncharacterized protein n=1 Tax=Candidozyma auris TaxID=498019 RepID=A0A0L0NP78_CANAR|nr:hypothetical protein QG37_07931 [[Candida] auris]